MRIVVTGATGTQGGTVAQALLRSGHEVCGVVRDPRSERALALAAEGLEIRVGDMLEAETLLDTLAESDALYAITTPFADGASGELAQGAALISAARRVAVPWVILASVASAGRAAVPHFASKAHIERQLAESSLTWTVVAPSYFYENILGAVPEVLASGVLEMPLPASVPLHQVSLGNLGAVVAAIIERRDEHLGARVELAADAPTPAAMAKALGARAVEVPLEEVRSRSSDMADMYAFLAETGYGIDVAAVRARYPEVPWQSFSDWAAELARLR